MAATTMLKEGDKAPDFRLKAEDGHEIALSDLRGKSVVLYFYPKANTPGCTTEGSEFRDAKPQFDKAGAVVLGVQRRWRGGPGEIQGQVQIQFFAVERSELRGHRSLRRAAHEKFSRQIVSRHRAHPRS